MKIKHKKLGVELEIKLPRAYLDMCGGHPFYKTEGGSFISHSDYDWELVKEEEWEDVTINFKGLSGAKTIHLDHNERFLYIDCIHNGPYFIIQRKKA